MDQATRTIIKTINHEHNKKSETMFNMLAGMARVRKDDEPHLEEIKIEAQLEALQQVYVSLIYGIREAGLITKEETTDILSGNFKE